MAIWIGIMMGWRVTGIRRNEKGRSARPYQLVSISRVLSDPLILNKFINLALRKRFAKSVELTKFAKLQG